MELAFKKAGSPEEASQPKLATILVNKYKQTKHLDFSNFKPDQLRAFFAYFKDHITEFDEDFQLQTVEQCLSYKIGDFDALESVIENWSKSMKEHIVEYIVKTLDPQIFYPIFHSIFQDLPVEKKNEYFELFSVKEPQNAIMIAPFGNAYTRRLMPDTVREREVVFGTDITTLVFEKEVDDFDKEGKPIKKMARVSVMDEYFHNFEAGKKLLESALKYGQVKTIQNIAGYIAKTGRCGGTNFLIPYLEQLVKMGVYTTADAKEIIASDSFISGDYFLYPEENEVLTKLTRKWEKNELSWYGDVQRYAEMDKGRVREMDHILGALPYLKKVLSHSEFADYIYNLIFDSSLPLLLRINEFKDDPALIKRITRDFEYTYAPLNDFEDIKKYIEAGFEKQAYILMCQKIKSGEYPGQFIINLDKLINYFSPEYQQKFIGFVKKNVPQVLITRPDITLMRNLDLAELLRLSAGNWGYLWQYNLVVYNMRKSLSPEEYAAKKKIYDKEVRKVFLVEPMELLNRSQIALQVFTQQEYKQMITDNLAKANKNFIKNFLYINRGDNPKISGMNYAALLEAVKKVIIEDDDVFCYLVTSQGLSYDEIFKIVPEKIFLEKLFKNKDKIDFEEVCSKDKFIEMLQRHPKYQDILLRYLWQTNKNNALVSLLDPLSDVLYYAEKEKNKKTDKQTKAMVNFCQGFYEKAELLFLRLVREDITGLYNERIRNLRKNLPVSDDYASSAAEYFATFPSDIEDFSFLVTKNYLDLETWQEIIRANIQYLAFNQDLLKRLEHETGLSGSLEDEDKKKIAQINPLAQIYLDSEKKNYNARIKDDFYQLALSRLKNLPLFDAYKSRLTKLAQIELNNNGEQDNLSHLHENQEFLAIARQLAIVKSSALTQDPETLAAIEKLAPSEMKDFLNLLEVLYLYNLDSRFKGLKLDFNNWPDQKQVLMKVVTEYLGKVFNLSQEAPGANTVNIELSLLDPMCQYYTSTCRKNPEMKKLFEQMAGAVLAGKYNDFRWAGETADIADSQLLLAKLKTAKLMPDNMSLQQFEIWQSEEKAELEAMFEYSLDDVNHDINKIFEQAVSDQHIAKSQLPESYALAKEGYDLLFNPLEAFSQREKELLEIFSQIKKKKMTVTKEENEELASEFKEVKARISSFIADNAETIKKAEAELYLAKLTNLSLEEIKTESLHIGKKKINLSKALAKISDYFEADSPEFLNNLENLRKTISVYKQKIFGEGSISKSKLFLTDKVDFSVNLKLGHEPVETCQNYDSDSNYNRGLLSYIVDPNLKIIQVYDENGSFIARSVLRVLADADNKPQLFVERVYSVNPHSTIERAIINFAKQKAEAMGAGLFSHEAESDFNPEDEVVIAELFSHASRNSFVYSDAGGGLIPKGEYTIKSAFKL